MVFNSVLLLITGLNQLTSPPWVQIELIKSANEVTTLVEDAQSSLDSLRGDSASSRRQKLLLFATQIKQTVTADFQSNRKAMILAMYLSQDSKEANQLQVVSPILSSLYIFPGPIYDVVAREVYIACAMRTSPIPDSKIGPLLLNLFSTDQKLQEAFVFDGMHGQMLTKDVARAQGIHRRHFKHLSEEIFLTRDTNLEYALFRRTKSDTHRRAALDGYKRIEKLTKNPEKKEICRSLIRELEQKG